MSVKHARPSCPRIAGALQSLLPFLTDGIYHSADGQLTKREFDLLRTKGYLAEIMKGWYFAHDPLAPQGITLWNGHYWPFVGQYLAHRFGQDEYTLSPESSLLVQAGLTSVPTQLIVLTYKSASALQKLPHNTSLMMYTDQNWSLEHTELKDGLRVMTVEYALSRTSEHFYQKTPLYAAAVLSSVRDAGLIGRHLVERSGVKSVYGGRVVAALRHIGRGQEADYLKNSLMGLEIEVVENNPFTVPIPALSMSRPVSAYAARIEVMWKAMREDVIACFPAQPVLPTDVQAYLDRVKALSVMDAFHSLSIEGYKVTEEMIQRLQRGKFKPRQRYSEQDRNEMAAKGYVLAAEKVMESLKTILVGSPAGRQVQLDYRGWYQAMFSPEVDAGILQANELFGYRGHQVYINGSNHVPPPVSAVTDAMEMYFDLLQNEPHPAVGAVLGHFFFGFIHPYGDGNGRMSRFLMNAMFAGGGYPWTVVRVNDRNQYLAALEAATTDDDITPFATMIKEQMERTDKEDFPADCG